MTLDIDIYKYVHVYPFYFITLFVKEDIWYFISFWKSENNAH